MSSVSEDLASNPEEPSTNAEEFFAQEEMVKEIITFFKVAERKIRQKATDKSKSRFSNSNNRSITIEKNNVNNTHSTDQSDKKNSNLRMFTKKDREDGFENYYKIPVLKNTKKKCCGCSMIADWLIFFKT